MDAAQKKIVIDAMKSAFTQPVPGPDNLVRNMMTDEQIETLFGAMCLIAAFGPPPMTDKK